MCHHGNGMLNAASSHTKVHVRTAGAEATALPNVTAPLAAAAPPSPKKPKSVMTSLVLGVDGGSLFCSFQ